MFRSMDREGKEVVMKSRTWFRSKAVWGLVLGLLTMGCGGSSPTAPTPPGTPQPSWVGALISEIQSQPVTSPPSSLLSYRYQGATVYFRPARCCDVMSDLYDQQGALLCHPDGGLTGNGDGRCVDFFANRTDEEVVWEDSRR